MKNDVAVFVAETILYIEEIIKLKSKEMCICESRTSLQFNREYLGPHYRKQLNNIKDIIHYYYPCVKLNFKIDKNGNITAFIVFNFLEEIIC